MFYDSNGRAYYAEHLENSFSLDALRQQGTVTVKEQVEKEQHANESTKDFIERIVKYTLGGLLVYGVVKEFISSRKK